MITFRIDARSGVPPYMQLIAQVRQALRVGALKVDDRLPTVKEVVASIAINPNTVLKAYRELEREGLICGRPGQGTFVLKVPPGPPPGVHVTLARSLAQWVQSARSAGLDDESIRALMDSTFHSTGAAGAA